MDDKQASGDMHLIDSCKAVKTNKTSDHVICPQEGVCDNDSKISNPEQRTPNTINSVITTPSDLLEMPDLGNKDIMTELPQVNGSSAKLTIEQSLAQDSAQGPAEPRTTERNASGQPACDGLVVSGVTSSIKNMKLVNSPSNISHETQSMNDTCSTPSVPLDNSVSEQKVNSTSGEQVSIISNNSDKISTSETGCTDKVSLAKDGPQNCPVESCKVNTTTSGSTQDNQVFASNDHLPSTKSEFDEGSGVRFVVYESEHQMPDIMRLITKDLSEPYSIYTYRYFIHNWPQLCFLAMDGEKCIGAIVSKLDSHKKVVRRGYIAMLAVDKDYRKRGIGSQLVVRAIRGMISLGCDEVVLETEINNKAALHLYENLGFVRDKRLFRYYLNGVDALRLKLWLR